MVYLICGSPCSGKSTYVKEHFKTGDIVCDVDRLYSALCYNEEHQTELYAQETASVLYETLLDMIRDRKGHWKNAYVISLANTDEKISPTEERVHADEVVMLDTPFEVCIERAKDRPPYFVWLIQEWYETRNINGECNSR